MGNIVKKVLKHKYVYVVDEITHFYVYVCVIVKMCKRKKKMSANKCIFLKKKLKDITILVAKHKKKLCKKFFAIICE